MAKVIEFYVPKRFRKPFVRADQAQAGKVIEFCSRAKAPASIPSFWRGHCVAPVRHMSNPAAGSEWSLRPEVAPRGSCYVGDNNFH